MLRSLGHKRYDVYEIYPLRESYFRMIASTYLEDLPNSDIWCTERDVVIHGSGTFIVWNWVADTWVQWESNIGVNTNQVSISNY